MYLLGELNQFQTIGLKLNYKTIRFLFIHILENSTSKYYVAGIFPSGSSNTMCDISTPRFLQSFYYLFGTASRALTGNNLLVP